ncbi:MAG: hypothetical protein ACLVLR_14450 [Turicibacter sanguinis]
MDKRRRKGKDNPTAIPVVLVSVTSSEIFEFPSLISVKEKFPSISLGNVSLACQYNLLGSKFQGKRYKTVARFRCYYAQDFKQKYGKER